ncbi:prohibitin family protein [Clostridium perfringens]|uniref:prohibitin family protein n=1 Tax=Clostridium perfringens TaxID=1502 RepID=UPI00096A4303|nr:prohibitin family protein [Clostridium perfringens]
MKKGMLGAIISGVLVASVGIGVLLSVEKIPAGYVGVVYSAKGGVEEDTLNQGWHLVAPWKKVTEYSVATEQLYLSVDEREGSEGNEAFEVMCKDGKMNVDFEMSYSFDPERVSELYTKYRGMNGEDIVNTIIRGKIKTFANEVSSQFTVIEAHMEKKAELNTMLTEHLRNELNSFGILVESANFTQTRVDETVEVAITERAKASQDLEAEKQRKAKAEIEAERKRIEAEGEANAQIEKAKGEAEANRLISDSITPELIKRMEMEARKEHGWITTQGGTPIVDTTKDGE